MTDGFGVDPDELRAHASNLEALQSRFEAVKSASAYIQQDDEAYGLLCGWIAAVLEGRHTRQDGLIDFAADNLGRAAQAIRDAAQDYEDADLDSGASFSDIEGQMGD